MIKLVGINIKLGCMPCKTYCMPKVCQALSFRTLGILGRVVKDPSTGDIKKLSVLAQSLSLLSKKLLKD